MDTETWSVRVDRCECGTTGEGGVSRRTVGLEGPPSCRHRSLAECTLDGSLADQGRYGSPVDSGSPASSHRCLVYLCPRVDARRSVVVGRLWKRKGSRVDLGTFSKGPLHVDLKDSISESTSIHLIRLWYD